MVHPKFFKKKQICFSAQPSLTDVSMENFAKHTHTHLWKQTKQTTPQMESEAHATSLVGSRSNAKVDQWSAQWSSQVFLDLPPQTHFFLYTLTLHFSNFASDQGRTHRNWIKVYLNPKWSTHSTHFRWKQTKSMCFNMEKTGFSCQFLFFLPQEVHVLQKTFSSWKMLATAWRNCRWCRWSALAFSRHSTEL